MKSARVNPGVAPGSGVYLGLEQGEIEALHVALAAGVAQGLEIAGVPHLVLVRRFLREVLAASAAASCRSQRHPRAQFSPRGRRTRHNSPDKGAPFPPPSPPKYPNLPKIFEGKFSFFFFFLRRKNSTPRDSSSPSALDSKTESTNSAKARRFVRSFERRESEPRHIEAFPLFFRATVFTQHRLPSRGVSVLIVNRPSFVGCSNSAVECNYFGTLFQSQWRIKIKGEDFNLNCTIYN